MIERPLLGQPLPRLDAAAKVTGQAIYAVDFSLPGMLHGKILRSPVTHGVIRRLDVTRARALPGVHAVLTARDIPSVRFGIIVRDQTVFAVDRVRYVGQPVAAIAADNLEIAEQALDLIEVEYDALPVLYDPEVAMEPGSPLIHEEWQSYQTSRDMVRDGNIVTRALIIKGDPDRALVEADYVFEDCFETGSQHAGHTEPHAAVASVDADGFVTVWSNGQLPFAVQTTLAEVLNLPPEQVRVVATCSGGGFGGKLRPATELYAALLAQATGRPVRLAMTLSEELIDANPRHPTRIFVRSSVMRDGTIVAREARIVLDAGAFAGSSPNLASVGTLVLAGPYRIPNLRLEGCAVYTNKLVYGSMRAPTAPQACFAIESHMDIVAQKLGMDPLAFRLKNIVEEGDPGPTGQVLAPVSIHEVLQRAAEAIRWDEPAGSNRGKGLACSWWTVTGGQSEVDLEVTLDGHVVLRTGAAEIGTGAITAGVPQILAEELALDLNDITIRSGDTLETPYDYGSQGSRTTFSVGNAVRAAAGEIRTQLIGVACEELDVHPDHLELRDRAVVVKDEPSRRIPLSEIVRIRTRQGGSIRARGSYAAPVTEFDPSTVVNHLSPVFNSPSFHAHAAEVEVDSGTGEVTVHHYVAVQDVGYTINPGLVEGQIEGGVVQGLGQALSEELAFHEGRVMNPNLTDYKMLTIRDVPPIEVVLVEHPSQFGPYGVRGMAEAPCIEPPAAIANAVAAAVDVRIRSLPITAEKILKALSRPA
ncbi:MAG TPA: aldehyde oxidase [Chloroflexi bacterium]|nr:aldehyde oxidase [Chloroflexota bacterium]